MALEILQLLQIIGAVLLMFFLPGFMLVQVLFPRKNELDEEYDLMFRMILGVGLSIVITVLDGFVLGSLGINPMTDKGFWDPRYISTSLVGITIILFFIGWYKGSYQFLKSPGKKAETSLGLITDDREKYYEYMDELKKYKKQLERFTQKSENATPSERELYDAKKAKLEKKVEELENELIEFGKSEDTLENNDN